MGAVLAVDFGSSNTAAAYRSADNRIHEVRLSSVSTLMPSAVLWSSKRIVVGQAALQAMLTNPDGFEPSPKRRLADREIFLGDALVPVTDLVAAVLAEVFARAERIMGEPPDRVVLTHPDKWSSGQQRQLADAAVQAGLAADRITLVTEATAAAQFYTATGRELPVGGRVAVCDFGAGTVDVAVLDKQPTGGFSVVAADGVDGLGGRDLDARIHGWVRRQLAVDDPVLGVELDDPRHLASRLTLDDRVRDAKEALSETTSTSVVVTGAAGTRVLQLTRDEFDGLIAADVDRAVELTRRVLFDANRIRPTNAAPTIYLAGGSSAIPLIHTRLAELGIIAALGDPKTVVCQGALHTVLLAERRPPPRAPVDRPAVPRIASPSVGPPRAVPTTPPSVAPQSPRVPPPPAPPPVGNPHRPALAQTAAPPRPAGPVAATPRRGRRALLVSVGAVVLVAAVVVAVGFVLARPGSEPPGRSEYGEQAVLPIANLAGPRAVAVHSDGTVVVSAAEGVVEFDVATNATTQLPFGNANVTAIAIDSSGTVYGAVLADFSGSIVKLASGSPPQSIPVDAWPYGLGLDDEANMYVASGGSNSVVKVDASSFAQTTLPFGEIGIPMDVAVDSDDNVYVSNSYGPVEMLPGGEAPQKNAGFRDLKHPEGLAVDKAGTVYVADNENDRIVLLRKGSSEQEVLPFSGLNRPEDVTVDDSGNVYVADTGNNRVVKLPVG